VAVLLIHPNLKLPMLTLTHPYTGYAFFLSPNQTPYRDKIFIERLVGLGDKDGFTVTPVFQAVFNLMGVYPALYASILIPGARSESKVMQC
jgi:hypothetical protein